MWLFTEKIGKITAIAKGAKKSKSKFISSTLPFSFGEYILYKGKSLYSINEVQTIESFQSFLQNLKILTYASYLNEIIYIALEEQESNRKLFKDFVSIYYFIKNEVGDIEILVNAFEIKLLKETGYGLNLFKCSICGKSIDKSNYINLGYYGSVCNECVKVNGFKITYATFNTLKYLIKFPVEKVYRLNASENVKKEIREILTELISQSYQKKPKSLSMLNFIKE